MNPTSPAPPRPIDVAWTGRPLGTARVFVARKFPPHAWTATKRRCARQRFKSWALG